MLLPVTFIFTLKPRRWIEINVLKTTLTHCLSQTVNSRPLKACTNTELRTPSAYQFHVVALRSFPQRITIACFSLFWLPPVFHRERFIRFVHLTDENYIWHFSQNKWSKDRTHFKNWVKSLSIPCSISRISVSYSQVFSETGTLQISPKTKTFSRRDWEL